MDQNFLVSLQLGDSFLWRARPELPLKRSLRANQWPPADARSHKFRVGRRDAAPASSDAPATNSLASWLTSTFTCAPGVRGPIARQSAVREIIRGRVGTAVTAERTAGASAGEPSRRRRVSGERPAPPRHRADVAAAAHTHTRSPFPHTETRECSEESQRALGHRQREGRAASAP